MRLSASMRSGMASRSEVRAEIKERVAPGSFTAPSDARKSKVWSLNLRIRVRSSPRIPCKRLSGLPVDPSVGRATGRPEGWAWEAPRSALGERSPGVRTPSDRASDSQRRTVEAGKPKCLAAAAAPWRCSSIQRKTVSRSGRAFAMAPPATSGHLLAPKAKAPAGGSGRGFGRERGPSGAPLHHDKMVPDPRGGHKGGYSQTFTLGSRAWAQRGRV